LDGEAYMRYEQRRANYQRENEVWLSNCLIGLDDFEFLELLLSKGDLRIKRYLHEEATRRELAQMRLAQVLTG